jgi:hypothetical protein
MTFENYENVISIENYHELAFMHKTRRGKFKLGRKTSRIKFTQKMTDMNIWLKSIRNFAERMVEGAGAKVAWTLPVLRNER